MNITEHLVTYITYFISIGGYPSIVILMALESMIAPVPSEAVMPFAGFLISQGKMTFTGIIFFSTLGSIIGSLISYYLGKYGGRLAIKKFGKYLLLDEHHLEYTEKFFQKYGDKAIFVSRFIPVVRHLISLPAGTGKMNIYKFSFYTILGAGLWNGFLTFVGFKLKKNWDKVKHYMEYVDILIVLLIILFVFYIIRKLWKEKRELGN